MRKVFLDELPKRGSRINWKDSIGYIVKFIYDDIEGNIEIVGYDKECVLIKYQSKDGFKINKNSLKKCMLGGLLDKCTDEFKVEINTIFKDSKRDLVITDREHRLDKNNNQNKKYYKYTCNKCGWTEGWMREYNLLGRKNGCACCCPTPRAVVEGINDIPTTAPWMVKFFVNPEEAKLYTKSSNKRIKVRCPDCGRVKDEGLIIKNIYKNKSINCSCSDTTSYSEKFMNSVLKQLNIDFQTQLTRTTFKWCKDYRYDFYIRSLNIIIETHGMQHYEKSHKGRTLEQEIKNDKLKKQLANNNNITKYLIIDCRYSDLEFIKNNILNSELNNLFDLNNIDWLKAEEFALSNRVKEACELKKNNPDMSTTEIGKIMKLDRGTIIGYLKKGSKLGWCEYNPQIKRYKRSSNALKSDVKQVETFKQVEIFKDGVSLGVFHSARELSRESKKLFGVKLDNSSISKVCRGELSSHKGYQFKIRITKQ